MATLSKLVGCEYEIVDQVPKDYFCKLCKHVAREPTIPSCCGECFCKACVDVAIQDKKPCPSCAENDFTHKPAPEYEQKILSLDIFCPMKDLGCRWIGKLQHWDTHREECRFQEVQCVFSYAGCQAKFIREKEDEHMKLNIQKHLALMPAATVKISQDFKRQLQQKDDQIDTLEKQLKALNKEIEDQRTELIPIRNKTRTHTSAPPYDVILGSYLWNKIKHGLIISKDLYTHPGGYQYSIRVWPNGYQSGEGTHVSIKIHAHKGQFFSVLKFPSKFTITLQLLNLRKDHHHTKSIECKVTKDKIEENKSIGADYQFITIADLEGGDFLRSRSWDWKGPDQDRLIIRVLEIIVH